MEDESTGAGIDLANRLAAFSWPFKPHGCSEHER